MQIYSYVIENKVSTRVSRPLHIEATGQVVSMQNTPVNKSFDVSYAPDNILTNHCTGQGPLFINLGHG